MLMRLILVAMVIGIGVSLLIARTGGPTERLTATWAFGLRALVIAVIVAEVVTQIAKRTRK